MEQFSHRVKASPRFRFWSVLGLTPVALLLTALLAPHLDPSPAALRIGGIVLLLAAWYWVLSAHAVQAGGFSMLSTSRFVLVTAGVTLGIFMALAATAAIGMILFAGGVT